MKSISVRQAQIEDIPQIINLYSGWQEFKGILPDQLIAPETEKDLLPYISGEKLNKKYLVAVSDQRDLVGVCYLDVSFESFQVIRIGDFIVEKQYRNQGIGKQILVYIQNYCKDRNIKKLWLWTQEELTGAIKFYKNNEFNIEGKQKAQFFGKDAILLGLII